jgi:hypothetical protein
MSKIMYFVLGGIAVLFLLVVIVGMAKSSDGSETFDTSHDTRATSSMSNFIKEDINEKYGVITLSSSKTGKLAEYSLTTNTELCLINCSAEGKVTLYQDGVIFDDVMFTTLTGQPASIKSSEYLLFDSYKDNYVDVPDTYKEVCVENALKETNCFNQPATYKKVNQPIEIWNKYDGSVLKAGDYRWKIKGVKGQGQSVDFVPVIKSKAFSEWATWTDSLNTGLVAYYKMDNATSNTTLTIDSVGYYSVNGTVTNALFGQSGKIGQSYYFDGVGDIISIGTDAHIRPTNYFTVAFWYKQDNTANGAYMMSRFVSVSREWRLWGGLGDSNPGQKPEFYVKGTPTDNIVMWNEDDWGGTNWKFIVGRFNGTAISIWINGTKSSDEESLTGGAMVSTAINTEIGGSGGTGTWKGWIDEVGIWNRSLTSAEISDLFNNGAGMTYIAPAGDMNITGKVVTSSGADVPNATIVILSSTGAWVANTTSNASGDWTYAFANGTIKNYTIIGYNKNNVSQGGNAYPFFNA